MVSQCRSTKDEILMIINYHQLFNASSTRHQLNTKESCFMDNFQPFLRPLCHLQDLMRTPLSSPLRFTHRSFETNTVLSFIRIQRNKRTSFISFVFQPMPNIFFLLFSFVTDSSFHSYIFSKPIWFFLLSGFNNSYP